MTPEVEEASLCAEWKAMQRGWGSISAKDWYHRAAVLLENIPGHWWCQHSFGEAKQAKLLPLDTAQYLEGNATC